MLILVLCTKQRLNNSWLLLPFFFLHNFHAISLQASGTNILRDCSGLCVLKNDQDSSIKFQVLTCLVSVSKASHKCIQRTGSKPTKLPPPLLLPYRVLRNKLGKQTLGNGFSYPASFGHTLPLFSPTGDTCMK